MLAKDIVITTGPGKENSYYDGIIRIPTIGKLVKSTKIASRSAHRAVTDQFLRSEHVTLDAQPLLQSCLIPEAVPRVGVKVRVNEALWPAAIVVEDKPPRLNSGLVEVAEEIFTLDAEGKSGPQVLTGWRRRLGADHGGRNGLSWYWGLNPTPIGPGPVGLVLVCSSGR